MFNFLASAVGIAMAFVAVLAALAYVILFGAFIHTYPMWGLLFLSLNIYCGKWLYRTYRRAFPKDSGANERNLPTALD